MKLQQSWCVADTGVGEGRTNTNLRLTPQSLDQEPGYFSISRCSLLVALLLTHPLLVSLLVVSTKIILLAKAPMVCHEGNHLLPLSSGKCLEPGAKQLGKI